MIRRWMDFVTWLSVFYTSAVSNDPRGGFLQEQRKCLVCGVQLGSRSCKRSPPTAALTRYRSTPLMCDIHRDRLGTVLCE
ncbi:hypothetical protein BJV77DRAFT_1011353 [Russula vinacea]|nr:hypothetical protein BJV77DRAFT_1011353 [Russula vinacea]